jgi:hypothetical protein
MEIVSASAMRPCFSSITLKISKAQLAPSEMNMNRKNRSHQHGRPSMSPLLRALTHSQAALEPVTSAMLLQCYSALDAFQRGYGSRGLFSTLGRYLLIAEELARLGDQTEDLPEIEMAHASLMHLDAAGRERDVWALPEAEYMDLCVALASFDRQLTTASLGDIATAEARMLEGLLRATRATVPVTEMA